MEYADVEFNRMNIIMKFFMKYYREDETAKQLSTPNQNQAIISFWTGRRG
jgi:hypothetical protein